MPNPVQLHNKKSLIHHIIFRLNEKRVINPEILSKTLLENILNKRALEPVHFFGNRVRLNNFNNLSEPELHYLIGRYQKRYSSLTNLAFSIEDKRFRSNRLTVSGFHATGCCFECHCEIIRGTWQMELYQQEGEWLVASIDLEGVDF